MRIKYLALVPPLLLVGCFSLKGFVIPDTNLKEANISTSTKIKSNDIVTYKPHRDIESIQFVVLRTDNINKPEEYYTFMQTMLLKTGFKKVISDAEFEKVFVQNDIHDVVSSTDDLASLHKVYQKVGPYLVITAYLNHINAYKRDKCTACSTWENEITIMDPEIPDTLLHSYVKKILWGNLDSELNYPAVNLINDWYKASI